MRDHRTEKGEEYLGKIDASKLSGHDKIYCRVEKAPIKTDLGTNNNYLREFREEGRGCRALKKHPSS